MEDLETLTVSEKGVKTPIGIRFTTAVCKYNNRRIGIIISYKMPSEALTTPQCSISGAPNCESCYPIETSEDSNN
ncbi:MAG: hypothetical protein ABIH72_05260 [archaeon]